MQASRPNFEWHLSTRISMTIAKAFKQLVRARSSAYELADGAQVLDMHQHQNKYPSPAAAFQMQLSHCPYYMQGRYHLRYGCPIQDRFRAIASPLELRFDKDTFILFCCLVPGQILLCASNLQLLQKKLCTFSYRTVYKPCQMSQKTTLSAGPQRDHTYTTVTCCGIVWSNEAHSYSTFL